MKIIKIVTIIIFLIPFIPLLLHIIDVNKYTKTYFLVTNQIIKERNVYLGNNTIDYYEPTVEINYPTKKGIIHGSISTQCDSNLGCVNNFFEKYKLNVRYDCFYRNDNPGYIRYENSYDYKLITVVTVVIIVGMVIIIW